MNNRWLDDINDILARDESPIDRLIAGWPEKAQHDMRAVMTRADALFRLDFGHPASEITPRTFWLGVVLSVIAVSLLRADGVDEQQSRNCTTCGQRLFVHDGAHDPHCACAYEFEAALYEIITGANWGLNVGQLRDMARNALIRNSNEHGLAAEDEPPESVSA